MRRMSAACSWLTLWFAPTPCWRSNTSVTASMSSRSWSRRWWWVSRVSVHFMCFDLICDQRTPAFRAAIFIQKYYCIFACVSGIRVSIKRWFFFFFLFCFSAPFRLFGGANEIRSVEEKTHAKYDFSGQKKEVNCVLWATEWYADACMLL